MDHRTIATMYSVRAAGTVASSLLVGYLFGSSFFTQKPGEGGCRKLALLSISQAIIAVSLMAVPFVKSFPVLLIGKRLWINGILLQHLLIFGIKIIIECKLFL